MFLADVDRVLALRAVLARGKRAALDSGGSVDRMLVLGTPVIKMKSQGENQRQWAHVRSG